MPKIEPQGYFPPEDPAVVSIEDVLAEYEQRGLTYLLSQLLADLTGQLVAIERRVQ